MTLEDRTRDGNIDSLSFPTVNSHVYGPLLRSDILALLAIWQLG
jgi:hypothetical protein